MVKFCQDNGIIVEAYCPLVRNQKADDPTLKSIAKKHNKETSHVLIRYCLQKGWVCSIVIFFFTRTCAYADNGIGASAKE